MSRTLVIAALAAFLAPTAAAVAKDNGIEVQFQPTNGTLMFTDTGGTYSIVSIDVNDGRCSFRPWQVSTTFNTDVAGTKQVLYGDETIKWYADRAVPSEQTFSGDRGSTTYVPTAMSGIQMQTGDVAKTVLALGSSCGSTLVDVDVNLADGSSFSVDFSADSGDEINGD